MKTLIGALCAWGLFVSVASAASTGYLKLGDIKGEAVTQEPETATLQLTGTAATGETRPVEGTAPVETSSRDGDKDVDGAASTEAKKGNVEGSWKVEEGEKAMPALLELDGVKGESSDKPKPQKSGEGTSGGQAGKTSKVDSITIKQSMKGGVSVATGDVNGDGVSAEEKQEFMLLVREHARVQSEQDLTNFAKGILLENTQAEHISLNYEKIQVKTRGTGKLIGFIPISFVQQVEIDADGEGAGKVRVKMPWYSFLLSPDIPAEEIEEEATRAIVENGGENQNWDFGARAFALKTLSNVLKTKHDTAKNSVGNIR